MQSAAAGCERLSSLSMAQTVFNQLLLQSLATLFFKRRTDMAEVAGASVVARFCAEKCTRFASTRAV